MKNKRLYLLLMLVFCVFPAQAERPKIGLALSGGGAKGSAHIAVLELLEANNIPIDYIAGTSIGAYVGGLYALGYTTAEIKHIMFNADFERGFSDAIPRENLPFLRKRQRDKFNLGIDLGYSEGEIVFPRGLLYGQSMSAVYRRSVGNIHSFDSFDDLAIPFHALATDLATSKEVVLDRGDLIQAMKASATFPGVLVPTRIDGKILVDGGMSQNLPIREAVYMGADIVIAVDITDSLQSIEEIKNAISVFDQISSFLTIHNVEDDIKLLDDNDFYIRPDVGDVGSSDFAAMDQAYEAGKVAAEQQLERLRKLSVSSEEYLQYVQRKSAKLDALITAAEQPVVKIILMNETSYNDEFLLYTLGLKTGVPITAEELLAALDRVYSLDNFENVYGAFEERDIGRVLVVDVVEKAWWPNYFQAGLGWEDDITEESIIDLDFAFTIGNITDNNGEWRNELGIGTNKSFRSELYLPLDSIQRYYQSSVYRYRLEDLDSFVDEQLDSSQEYTSHRIDFALGRKLGNWGIVEAGITFEAGNFSSGDPAQKDLDYQSPGVFLSLGYDTLDSFSFPSRGSRLQMSIIHRSEDLSGGGEISTSQDLDDSYYSTQYLLEWKSAISHGNHGLIAEANLAVLDSEADSSIYFVQLGGFLNLSGYARNSLIGNQSAFAALQYQYNLGRSLFGLKNFPIYFGSSIETGNVWSASESIDHSELITAGSVYLSTDSKLGPIAIAYGKAEGDHSAVYFYLGKSI
jgi:NTE family protein